MSVHDAPGTVKRGARERLCRYPTGARVAGLRRGPRGFALASQVELPSWKFRPATKILRSPASFCYRLEANFIGRGIDCPDQVRNESDSLCGRPRVAGAIELRDPRDAGLSCRQRRPEHYNKFEGDFFLFSPSHAQHSVEGDGDSFSSSWRTEIRCPHAR